LRIYRTGKDESALLEMPIHETQKRPSGRFEGKRMTAREQNDFHSSDFYYRHVMASASGAYFNSVSL